MQHARTALSVRGFGNVSVLAADLLLEAIEVGGASTQDGQIDVDQERRVACRRGVVRSGQDVACDAFDRRVHNAELTQLLARKVRAALFVVVAQYVVDHVVKPQGQLHFCRMLSARGEPIEPAETRIDMHQRVVVPMCLAVTRDESVEHSVAMHVGLRNAHIAQRRNKARPKSKVRTAVAVVVFVHGPSLSPVDWLHNQSMGRPSNRTERRAEILAAFARVLSDHGYTGATIAAVATEAGIAPGLVHHHFHNKAELLSCLLQDLIARFRERIRNHEGENDALLAYIDAALKLDDRADLIAAKAWVSIFAEALRNPTLFDQVRRLIDTEIATIQTRSRNQFGAQDAGAVLAFVIGSLVLGAFAPKKTAGFAAPGLRTLVAALRAR